ncbi:amino acid adenylation protein [Paractinoplanes abujensis]|uniref:Amino acid adenylation domain-containing protein n=1 Tax=Paractinoplanes abujensis TaxID=882441 RepID=A0A7W7G0U7_9ACTN|nr:AMP-binding protein [Actinoplanes abujensis]MBB4689951.1 amino acid adenylation domain-containing protein [Actinoplanes abujensis]GID24642.1 amino acid adenylation protein [Actinoplanes abujensis]
MTETPIAAPGLHERFLRGLARSPHRTALCADGESLTYEALHALALRRAGALAADGSPVVAVLADKGVTAYAGILAALYAGATVVPLNPRFPAERTRSMLSAAGAGAVVADDTGRAALARTELDLPVLPEGAPLNAPAVVRPSDVAYVLFTSGSTGRPKGVPVTHAANQHYFGLLDARYDFAPDDVFSQYFGLSFDCAMFELFCAWGHGAAVHPVPPAAHRDLPAFVAERRMTVWFSVPSGIALTRQMGGLPPGSMPSLRWSFFAGEALLCADAADWQAAAPRSQVENLYGPTELTITVSGHRWSPGTSAALAVNGVVPIGRIHAGHEIFLDSGRDAQGTSAREGELCVSGPQLTPGYLDPEDDAGRFFERDGRRWYRTGDRVRLLDDGELLYLGRIDSQVQIQGFRVELAEVDHAVRQCPGVTNAATVTRPAPSGGLELLVYYTGDRVHPAVLRRELSTRLPEAMLPKAYRHLPEFPLNANRKIDRRKLAGEAARNG